MKSPTILHDAFPSRHVSPRPVEVWLPPAYHAESEARFPVLYMHDGQNLFHPGSSFTGEHWGVPEAFAQGIEEGQLRETIVVGIWHSDRRGAEYVPKSRAGQDAFADNPDADRYLTFCVEELKPFIDETYRTRADAPNTFIMGSSLGALISLYALCTRPAVFGGAACVSTHWPAEQGATVDYLATALPPAGHHRWYFDYGSETLDSRYAPYQKRVDEIMAAGGYRHGEDWVTRYFPGQAHDEKAWRRRLHLPLAFLLGTAKESA